MDLLINWFILFVFISNVSNDYQEISANSIMALDDPNFGANLLQPHPHHLHLSGAGIHITGNGPLGGGGMSTYLIDDPNHNPMMMNLNDESNNGAINTNFHQQQQQHHLINSNSNTLPPSRPPSIPVHYSTNLRYSSLGTHFSNFFLFLFFPFSINPRFFNFPFTHYHCFLFSVLVVALHCIYYFRWFFKA